MFRLLRSVALLTAVLAGICAAAVSVGRAQPHADDARADWLRVCDGLPCFAGLTPGRSAWADVGAALDGWTQEIGTDKQAAFSAESSEEVLLFRSLDQVTVGRVQVMLRQPLDGRWLLARYGAPCGVSFYYYQAGLLTLRYPALLANVQMNPSGHLNTVMQVVSVQFHDPAFKMPMQPDVCVDNITDGARNHRWRGFAPLWYYAALPFGAG